MTVFSCHFHVYLLHSSQVMELGTIDLLLQHELLEILSSIRLSLQCLKSLDRHKERQILFQEYSQSHY